MNITLAQIMDKAGNERLEKVNGDIDQAYDVLEGNKSIISFTLLGTVDPLTRQIKTIFLPHEVCNNWETQMAYDDKVTGQLENWLQNNRMMVGSC